MISCCWSGEMPPLSWILSFIFSIVSVWYSVSDTSTSRVIVFPLRILMKIYIPPVKGSTRCKVDYFWMLYSQRGCPYSSSFPSKIRCCWSGGMPSLSWILSVRILMKICIPPVKGSTRCELDLFFDIVFPKRSSI